MHFDFAAALVAATFITGLIWAADVWYFAPRRKARDGEDAREPVIVDYSRSLFPVILIVLLLRSFLAEPFRIPSGSMMPTLMVGDFILVNKYEYGLRLPVLRSRVTEGRAPTRGEVAVFRYPEDERIDFVKRIIGLPGDEVAYREKRLYINGEPVPQEYAGTFDPYPAGVVERRTETMDGKEYEILVVPGDAGRALEFSVPEGQYFVLGDNRDNSRDSRSWGMVPEANLVGRAVLVWMSWRPGDGPEWGRIGTRIQ